MTPDRRGQKPLLRFLLWFVAPFDDRLKGLSMARLLAIWCFLLVTHNVVIEEQAISGWDYMTLLLGAALWAGKKAVYSMIARSQANTQHITQDITQRIDIRREPSPTDDERG